MWLFVPYASRFSRNIIYNICQNRSLITISFGICRSLRLSFDNHVLGSTHPCLRPWALVFVWPHLYFDWKIHVWWQELDKGSFMAGFGADRTGALAEQILGWHDAMRCDAKRCEDQRGSHPANWASAKAVFSAVSPRMMIQTAVGCIVLT